MLNLSGLINNGPKRNAICAAFKIHTFKKRFSTWSLIAVLLPAAFVVETHAQWLTETIELKAGWNAVFLHVDPSHESLQSMVGSDGSNPITQVWRWNTPKNGQFHDNPQDSTFNVSGWIQWIRNDSNPALNNMAGDTAYLVESATDYTWEIKGRPVPPRHYWNLEGLNLIGFPTVSDNPTKLDVFLDGASDLEASDFDVYQYSGLTLDTSNPMKIPSVFYRSVPVARGQAFWMHSGDVFNTYFGPFEVDLASRQRIDFGENTSAISFRLRNLTDQPSTISLDLIASESAPSGEPTIDGLTPLVIREALDLETLQPGYSVLSPGNGYQWTLAAKGEIGSEVEVVLGLDRSVISEAVGSQLAGVLKFTDSLGQLSVHVPVEASVGSDAGLWVGQASVTQVNQYLKSYESGATDPLIITNGASVTTNDLVITTNGNYVVYDINDEITGVAKPFPLHLIVHSPEGDNAQLLQHVFFGLNVYSNPVISRTESVLDPQRLDSARRITATHLPWTEENPGWSFDGELEQGNTITATVATDFNDQRSNPFLHTYHPDHDNLDAGYNQELGQGAESYSIVRSISLEIAAPGTNFTERVTGHESLFGNYLETIEVQGNGADSRGFETRGYFQLNRISDIPVITNEL